MTDELNEIMSTKTHGKQTWEEEINSKTPLCDLSKQIQATLVLKHHVHGGYHLSPLQKSSLENALETKG